MCMHYGVFPFSNSSDEIGQTMRNSSNEDGENSIMWSIKSLTSKLQVNSWFLDKMYFKYSGRREQRQGKGHWIQWKIKNIACQNQFWRTSFFFLGRMEIPSKRDRASSIRPGKKVLRLAICCKPEGLSARWIGRVRHTWCRGFSDIMSVLGRSPRPWHLNIVRSVSIVSNCPKFHPHTSGTICQWSPSHCQLW